MTTLPQMTTLRLPRTPQSTQLAMPSALQIPASAQAAASRMTGGDVWRVIRANLWLILLTLAASAGLGYFANQYLAQHYPRYTATGLVKVEAFVNYDPLKAGNVALDSVALQIEQRTQAQLLKQEYLMSQVLTKSDKIRDTDWFKSFKDIEEAKKDLRDNFGVAPVPDTKLIAVSMTWHTPKDVRTIVDEIVTEHLNEQKEVNQEKQRARSQVLNNMLDSVSTRLKDVQREIREMQLHLNINGMGVPGHLSAKEMQLEDLIRRQLEIQALAGTAAAQYNATEQAVKAGRVPPKVEEFVNKDMSIAQYRSILDNIDLNMAAAGGNGANSPQMAKFKAQHDMIEAKLNDAKAEIRQNATDMLLAQLKEEKEQTEAALNSVSAQIEQVKSDLGTMQSTASTYLQRKDEERQLLKQQDEVNQELERIVTLTGKQDLATVQWMTRPDLPGSMSFPKLSYTMPTAIMLGLLLSLGIAFLREAMDTSIRSPRDVARVGQLNLLGMVPDEQDDPQAAGSRLPLVIFDAPNSALAEQLRQVRTRLQMAASLDTTRSLMVTSPGPGDGKSTIACNLATGLALNGRKILLVDANFRRPELHKIFGLENEVGFSDALASVDRFNEVIHETQVPNLSVMTTGTRPANPTELLESQLLTDFIEQALREFDHVIFDSGPLLFVSDSVALAPRVDGVVTVVRARSNSRGVLQRMRDMLRQIKAEHLGVVLNAVRAQGGGYYGRNIKTYYAYQNGE